MIEFAKIRARAEDRKGGPDALTRLLPAAADPAALARLTDDRVLAEIARRVFCAGFNWGVIDAKWPGFEAAFLGFEPGGLTSKADDFWDALTGDPRIVRHGAKIMSVRHNAYFLQRIAADHGSFGLFLSGWPPADQIGVLDLLTRQGGRLGGATGQMLLRNLGWDCFILSKDVVVCLRDGGLDIAEEVKSKGDLAKVQAQFNTWAEETALPYRHLSRICAMSIGENYVEESGEPS